MDPLVSKMEALVCRLEKAVCAAEEKKGEQSLNKEAKTGGQTAFMAELAQKGTGVTKDLKAVEKGKKPEAAKPAKQPTIIKNGPKIFYENYKDTNIILKAEDLNMTDGYCFEECLNCTFELQARVKNIFVDKCKNVKLHCQVIISCLNIRSL